jgi:hypothetical protein
MHPLTHLRRRNLQAPHGPPAEPPPPPDDDELIIIAPLLGRPARENAGELKKG